MNIAEIKALAWHKDKGWDIPGHPLNSIKHLIARVDELEAALRPFAEEGAKWTEQEEGGIRDEEYPPDMPKFDLGDLRRAALAMKAPAKPEYKQEFDGG